jgi:hypothetical protein
MQSITEIIKPIQLKRGTHADTAKTGSGCFMNVIGYLNGEAQITDQSTCVCPSIRPMAIYINDLATDEEREQLLPFIERAMSSATTDHAEIIQRVNLVVEFSNEMAQWASKYAQWASKYAQWASKYAQWASKCAQSASEYAPKANMRALIFQRGVKLLDDMCPKLVTHDPVFTQRAIALAQISSIK